MSRETDRRTLVDPPAMADGLSIDSINIYDTIPYNKTCLDRVASVVILVVTAPLILAAMALVKLTSRGPALYSQVRLGRHGRPYKIYKIRTMIHDCERATGPRWSTSGDPRITPLGRVLRATHLDELPQLWNVLRGEMNLVGPRPERPEIASQLELALPRYPERTAVRPGLTGLAQIQLPADTDLASVRRKLACDLYYVRRHNFWMDLRILLSTAMGVVGIPFTVPQRLLRVPSWKMIEQPEENPSGDASIPTVAVPQTQSQPA